MRKILTLLLLSGNLPAQNQTFSISLFYNINEISSTRNLERLDSLCNLLGSRPATVSIYGHADFLSSPNYNLSLSQKRSESVKEYFLKKAQNKEITIANCRGLGEADSKNNGSLLGEPTLRRVDVIVNLERPSKIIGSGDNRTPEELPEQLITSAPSKKPVTLKEIDSLQKGETITVEGLNFIPGRHVLVPKAVSVLEDLLGTLKAHPSLKIEIQGHVCCPGDGHSDGFDFDSHDYNLSENRAKAIYLYLVKNGIGKDRLTYKGYGRTRPKVEETGPAEEQINRRVEIRILEN